jgi:ZIP family zinc transporter
MRRAAHFPAMPTEFANLIAIALAGAIASPLGGALALWKRPTTLTLSIAVGFAAGVLLGTFAFKMLPKAALIGSLWIAIAGFAAGFLLVYLLDLFVHRGVSAGEKAEQRLWVVRRRQKLKPRGDEVTVLAAGTSAEELIEGVTIGVSAATDPALGLVVALAIAIDNISEAMSIGELVHAAKGPNPAGRIFFWTGLIGAALFASAIAGWLLFRGMPPAVLGFLLASGAGGMFYLTITALVPEAESHHYNQSAAIANAAGFLLMFALSGLM